jgi:hypothetical protein
MTANNNPTLYEQLYRKEDDLEEGIYRKMNDGSFFNVPFITGGEARERGVHTALDWIKLEEGIYQKTYDGKGMSFTQVFFSKQGTSEPHEGLDPNGVWEMGIYRKDDDGSFTNVPFHRDHVFRMNSERTYYVVEDIPYRNRRTRWLGNALCTLINGSGRSDEDEDAKRWLSEMNTPTNWTM